MKVIDKDKLATDLRKAVLDLEKSLNKLQEDISKLQQGDEHGLYWNGENALKVNKILVGHLNHDAVLLENIKKCSEYMNSL